MAQVIDLPAHVRPNKAERGARLRQLLRYSGHTLQWLADRTGIHATHLSAVQNGRRLLSEEDRWAVAYILRGEGDPAGVSLRMHKPEWLWEYLSEHPKRTLQDCLWVARESNPEPTDSWPDALETGEADAA